MRDMGPKRSKAHMGYRGSTQGIHVPKPWFRVSGFRVSDFDNFATHT